MTAVELLAEVQRVIAAIEIGAGSEHFKHGRETMRDDAVKAVSELREKADDEDTARYYQEREEAEWQEYLDD